MKTNSIFKPFSHPEWIPSGKLFTAEMEMVPYPDHRTRTVRVWLPEDYDGVKRFPVIYCHDGQSVFTSPERPETLLNMNRHFTDLASEGISAIVVAVDTGDKRLEELTPPGPRATPKADPANPRLSVSTGESTTPIYAAFITDTLMPLIDATFMTLTDAENTCILGGSAGGSCALYMALKYPEVYGRAIILSPGLPRFTLEGLLDIVDQYDMDRIKDSRIAFYNGDQGLDATSMMYVIAVYNRLKARGMDRAHLMALIDTRESHTCSAWSANMPELLRFIYLKDNTKPL